MYVKQDLAMLFCKCLNCQGVFILVKHNRKVNTVQSIFECRCGRRIIVKEKLDSVEWIQSAKRVLPFAPTHSKKSANRLSIHWTDSISK